MIFNYYKILPCPVNVSESILYSGGIQLARRFGLFVIILILAGSHLLRGSQDTARPICLKVNRPAFGVCAESGAVYLEAVLGLGQVEAVEVHHFVPGGYEIADEFFLVVVLGVDFGQGAQL